MPRSYAPQFRAMVVEQVRSGRPVAEVAADLELSEGTVFRWVRQDRIDRGELAGTPSAESAELRAAKRRIADLEAELATVKRAIELFDKGRVVRPKELFGIVESLASEGHGTKRTCASSRWRPRGSSGGGRCRRVAGPSAAPGWPTSSPRSTPAPEPPTAGGAYELSSPTPTARR